MIRHDTVRRALRTFVQAFLATVLLLLPGAWEDVTGDVVALLTEVGTAGVYAAAIAVVTWLHNELEDAGRIRDTRTPRGPRS